MLLRVDSVHKHFRSGRRADVHAVNDVSFTIEKGETVALIGESGSGKSTLARAVLGLLRVDSGEIEFQGNRLDRLDAKSLRSLRSRMTIVFQEPYESLNPRMTVGGTVEEPLIIHEPGLSRPERRRRVERTLEEVALSGDFADRYPHELSGGQQQRVGIARAIVTRPDLVVLDEPTSSLDVSVRAQILQLLADLQAEHGMGYLLVSHDLPTVEYVADRICVMYLGRLVETGRAEEIVKRARHPYTQALIASTLSLDPDFRHAPPALVSEVPGAEAPSAGCVFYGRCPLRSDECLAAEVPLRGSDDRDAVACIKVPVPEP